MSVCVTCTHVFCVGLPVAHGEVSLHLRVSSVEKVLSQSLCLCSSVSVRKRVHKESEEYHIRACNISTHTYIYINTYTHIHVGIACMHTYTQEDIVM